MKSNDNERIKGVSRVKFDWDDVEGKWMEGEEPRVSPFLTWVREKPAELFIILVIGLTWFSIYGGKIIFWIVKHVFS